MAGQRIDDTIARQLTWRQPDIRRPYTELWDGQQVVASLSFSTSGLFTSRCEGQIAGITFSFRRKGFWRPGYVVQEAGSGREVAVYRQPWIGHGHVTFEDGTSYRYRHQDRLAQESCFMLDNQKVMTFKMLNRPWQRSYRYEATLDLHQTGLPGEPALILLGWYMKVLEASQQLP